MYQLSHHTAKLAPAAMPQHGAGALFRDRVAQASATKVVVRALEAIKQDASKEASAAAPEVPPSTLPLQLRPANRLGNLHRLQDLLTDFLHTPPASV